MTIKFKQVLALGIFIAVCEVAGLFGTLFTAPAIPGWYAGLVKPWFSPPNWLFGPVWAGLYALMGTSAFLVWRQGFKRPEVKRALAIFTGQLLLNAAWSVIFFGFKSPLAGLIEIIAMWLVIIWTIGAFKRLSQPAAWLLVPYLLWVTFATCLNAAIWWLN